MVARIRGSKSVWAGVVAWSLLASPARAQTAGERFLRDVAGVSGAEVARLADGTPLVKTVDSGDRRELTQVYIIRVRAPVRFILDQIQERHLLVDDAAGNEARGFFSDPPTEGDLGDLTFPRGEIRDLERCRPRECELKLPIGSAERAHRSVDWNARTAEDDANRFLREMLLETLRAYADRGDAAGLAYEDKEEPLVVEKGFERLFDDARRLRELDVPFYDHLRGFPESRAPEVEDAFSWTVEDLGLKSLVSLNHIAITEHSAVPGTALIGIKRFYSSHYFQAGLKIITLSPASGDAGAPDTYVTVLAYFRFDAEFGGLKRIATERRLERNAESALAAVRERLEMAYRQ